MGRYSTQKKATFSRKKKQVQEKMYIWYVYSIIQDKTYKKYQLKKLVISWGGHKYQAWFFH